MGVIVPIGDIDPARSSNLVRVPLEKNACTLELSPQLASTLLSALLSLDENFPLFPVPRDKTFGWLGETHP